ncbi:hypothetical protein CA850_29795 [Micromonospora echinospora]|uniref:Uncharacterized protein n=1 Tax=Micromonospora echinospora TaxID=1877 RepID=A0A1C5AAU1_MICEC|nr:hypothetical protein [Micromonospora echinospora]OZV74773.1 hypothetical protein CA850_29795 [Micromonospora echinospora]SCF42315.1 hypothetical protein GA0070618_6642 [Micromonospora echinospora]
MSLPPLVPVAALERRMGLDPGTLTGSDLVRAGVALEDASALVRAEGLDWVADDGVTITAPAVVLKVARDVALRQYRNPDGYQGENIGEYGYQYARGQAGDELTAAEVATVRRAAGKTAASVYTVRTPSAYECPPTPDPFPAVTA